MKKIRASTGWVLLLALLELEACASGRPQAENPHMSELP